MGCTQSKIENEEAVTRCKDRKQFMKESVSARNAFAAAHSAYAMSLKNTGAALSDYAHGEVIQPPHYSKPYNSIDHTSATSSSASNNIILNSSNVPATSASDSLPPPPPPLPNFSPAPLQRAASMPEFKVKTERTKREETILEDEEKEEEEEVNEGLKRRSGSSKNRSGGGKIGGSGITNSSNMDATTPPPPPEPNQWDYFFSDVEHMPGPTLSEVAEGNQVEIIERNVHTTRNEDMAMDKKKAAKVFEEEETNRKGGAVDDVAEENVEEVVMKNVKKGGKQGGVGVMEGRRGGGGGIKALANVNLLHIFIDLDDHFLKASESAHEVSKMLEATRLHYHSNFADNRGHIDHSARVMRVITWNRSFRGLANPDDGKDDFDSEENETHATVLDKLLAWEKKLYDEVKAGELMKFDYQKKVAHLNKQKKRGTNSEALEKARAAVSHLHTRYIVDMQSMDSTVSEINRLRDEQLYPKLVALVDGMATMWETMRVHHESQSKLVNALKFLDISHSPKETSEYHRERTNQLCDIVHVWHVQFEKLVNHQKEYIKSLNSWLKLNLIPIESSLKEKVSSPPRVQSPPIQSLLRAWYDHLDKLPDAHAKSAISNFAAIMHAIAQHQEDEMILKVKCEETRKELTRKSQSFESWYHKYMQGKIPDEYDPERTVDGMHDEVVVERKFAVELVKKRLEEEEEAYQKQCLQVREKSLFSLKSNLPELFRALSDFSLACSDMYRNLRSISQHRNPQ